MKKLRPVVFCVTIFLIISCFWGCKNDITVFDDGDLDVTPDPSKYINAKFEDEGLCIFSPGYQGGYRYGPSLITNSDGSVDAWFAGPGGNNQWDWIYYRRSTDGGNSWTQEEVVLMGTSGSRDQQSVCDPGVIKIGKYYYLGYTSTIYNQVCNSVFVARSKNPEGPYFKWDGEGWSEEPQPIVYYDEDPNCFGAGEPSFVEKNGVLYIYVNWINSKGQYTKVYTADATVENWPATMEYKGNAIAGRDGDSLDVKFVDDFGKFVGVCVSDRMSGDSKITFYQSDDGLNFTLCSQVSDMTSWGAHNAGISSRPDGHIRLKDNVYVGYAYGSKWARWSTRLQKVTLYQKDSVQDDTSVKAVEYQDQSVYYPGENGYITGMYASDVRLLLGHTPNRVALLKLNKYGEAVPFTDKELEKIKFEIWDESVATIDDETHELTAHKAGVTHMTATYENFSYNLAVYVCEEKSDYYQQSRKEVLFTASVCTDYTISLGYDTNKQIRGMLYYSDGSFEEIADARFKVENSSICYVDRDGYIWGKAIGETKVNVSHGDVGEFTVKVKVVE